MLSRTDTPTAKELRLRSPLRGSLRKCPKCAISIKKNLKTVEERNLEARREFEIPRTFNARSRVWKRSDSARVEAERNEYVQEKKKDRETEEKEEEKRAETLAKRKEKHRLRTRAHKKVRLKARKKNNQPCQQARFPPVVSRPQAPLSDEKKSEEEKEKVEENYREVRALPGNAPTFQNRAVHSVKVDVKPLIRRTKSMQSKFIHKYKHLYSTKKERNMKMQDTTNSEWEHKEIMAMRDPKPLTKHRNAEEGDTMYDYQRYLQYLH